MQLLSDEIRTSSSPSLFVVWRRWRTGLELSEDPLISAITTAFVESGPRRSMSVWMASKAEQRTRTVQSSWRKGTDLLLLSRRSCWMKFENEYENISYRSIAAAMKRSCRHPWQCSDSIGSGFSRSIQSMAWKHSIAIVLFYLSCEQNRMSSLWTSLNVFDGELKKEYWIEARVSPCRNLHGWRRRDAVELVHLLIDTARWKWDSSMKVQREEQVIQGDSWSIEKDNRCHHRGCKEQGHSLVTPKEHRWWQDLRL